MSNLATGANVLPIQVPVVQAIFWRDIAKQTAVGASTAGSRKGEITVLVNYVHPS